MTALISLGMLVLARDVSNGCFFNQLPSRALSPLQLGARVPCSTALWEAGSAGEWSGLATVEHPLYYSQTLKTLLGNGEAKKATLEALQSTAFGVQAIVQGLLAVSWDMKRRNLFSGCQKDELMQCPRLPDLATLPVSPKTIPLMTAMSNSLDLLLRELYKPHRTAVENSTMDWINLSTLFNQAQVYVSNVPADGSESIQVFAGVSETFTGVVRRDDYLAAGREVRGWAKTAAAVDTARRAGIHLLDQIGVVFDLFSHTNNSTTSATGDVSTIGGPSDDVIHGWSIYLGFLAMWSFYEVRKRDREPGMFPAFKVNSYDGQC